MRKVGLAILLAIGALALVLCVGCSGEPAKSEDMGVEEGDLSAFVHADTLNAAANVGEYLQMPQLAGGCEVASLICVLEAMGFEVDVDELVESHLDMDGGGSFGAGYIGSPYVFGSGYPPVLARCANAFFAHHDSTVRAMSVKGCDFADVVADVDRGRPVMVWTTMEMMPVFHTGSFSDGFEWYDNEHCVVVYGATDQEVMVSDPLDGLVVRDRKAFEEIFDDCGGLAVLFY